MAETASCVVCDRVKPTSRMRYGKYYKEVGRDVYDGSSSRRGNSHSASFGSSGRARFSTGNSSGSRSGHSVRRRLRPVTGYACRYHGLIGRIVTRLVIVGVLGFIAFAYLNNKFSDRRHAAHHQQLAASDGVSSQSADQTDQSAPHQRGTSSYSDGGASPEASSARPLAATLIADPNSEPHVDDAMKEALATGGPQRWHVHKLHGYAVPSAPDAGGCRMIQVSIDETGDKSSATKLCP